MLILSQELALMRITLVARSQGAYDSAFSLMTGTGRAAVIRPDGAGKCSMVLN